MSVEKPRPTFEHETCSRCCGTGQYSFNMMHGTRCYGCGGSGYKLTKRGAAAQKYLDALRVKPASEVRVGDLVLFDMTYFRCFAKVESIEPDPLNDGIVHINGSRPKTGEAIGFGFWNTPTAAPKMVRMGFTEEEKRQQVAAALAYQDTLTKQGVPAKRRA